MTTYKNLIGYGRQFTYAQWTAAGWDDARLTAVGYLAPEPKWVQIVRAALTSKKQARVNFPYCLHRTDIPSVACIVNRRYKPIGTESNAFADYEAATDCHVEIAVRDKLRELEILNHGGYFFTDGNPPFVSTYYLKAYRQKLAALIELWEAR